MKRYRLFFCYIIQAKTLSLVLRIICKNNDWGSRVYSKFYTHFPTCCWSFCIIGTLQILYNGMHTDSAIYISISNNHARLSTERPDQPEARTVSSAKDQQLFHSQSKLFKEIDCRHVPDLFLCRWLVVKNMQRLYTAASTWMNSAWLQWTQTVLRSCEQLRFIMG